ncbi:unnamed protein product [Peronospora destructor]|uniref:Uncharacterized protein n=1 Tax=Peronospora destructor TaxID=86335 RepID=A0AAV0V005_9STRA|nr:unnamed protein product [Peronospora destructor]
MPETSSPTVPSDDATTTSPSIVGNTFMRQYYHFLAKEPQSLHRFYKAESRWCHGVGSHMEEPIAGQQAINDQILKRGYAGARVDLDAGSIDCQNSLGGGVFVLVTGVMTLRRSPDPKPFVQTFFLAVQPKGYFVLNDCLRFLALSNPSTDDVEKEKSLVVEKSKETDTHVLTLSAVETIEQDKEKKEDKQEETFVFVSPEKATSPVKTSTEVTTTKMKEDTSVSPVKAVTTIALSPIKKSLTTTKEKAPAIAAKTLSPVEKLDQTPVATASSVPVPESADSVVSVPAEPEKPKTWAALFSASKTTASITPFAVASPAATPAKPVAAVTPAPTAAPAVISPTSGASAPEESPKNMSSNGNEKEKEYKRMHSLFIRDLPLQTRENDLHELFKAYGSIAGVTVVLQRNFAFVDFYEQESMRAALAEMKEFKLFNKVLQVTERGDRKEGQRGGFRGNDSRGRGRGHGPKSGRGDRKERLATRESGSRRGGKVDGTPRTE